LGTGAGSQAEELQRQMHPEFASLDQGLCEEIVQRSQWQRAETNGTAVAANFRGDLDKGW
jgi:hypothetical protein